MPAAAALMSEPADAALLALAAELGELARSRRCWLATAESCTGGWLAQVLTAVPGASHWFERGFVTYSNRSKCESLGVATELLLAHGAVSEAVVQAMARGARERSGVELALATSGVAGPGGGSADKPVGTVCIAVSGFTRSLVQTFLFAGDREAIRRQSVAAAIGMGLVLLREPPV